MDKVYKIPRRVWSTWATRHLEDAKNFEVFRNTDTFKALGQRNLKFLNNYIHYKNINISILTIINKEVKAAKKIIEYIYFYSTVDKSKRAKRRVSIMIHKNQWWNQKLGGSRWSGESIVIVAMYVPSEDACIRKKPILWPALISILKNE